MKSLGHFQNQNFKSAISGFVELVKSDATNDLADNSQYWLAECYYSQKDFKRAIAEFEKVFTYAGTDKDDDAQLKIGLSYQSIGNIDKAKKNFKGLSIISLVVNIILKLKKLLNNYLLTNLILKKNAEKTIFYHH